MFMGRRITPQLPARRCRRFADLMEQRVPVTVNAKAVPWPYWVGSVALVILLVAMLAYAGAIISELQDLRAELREQIASDAASVGRPLASDTEPFPSAFTGTDRIVAAIGSLRDDLDVVRDTLDNMQANFLSTPMVQSNYGGLGATAPDIGLMGLPGLPRPGPSFPPGSSSGVAGGISDEAQDYVEAVFRDHSARAKERIATQSSDPTRPDFEVMSRVMQESQREMAAELRDVLPQEEFEALFPPELGLGIPAAGR